MEERPTPKQALEAGQQSDLGGTGVVLSGAPELEGARKVKEHKDSWRRERRSGALYGGIGGAWSARMGEAACCSGVVRRYAA